MLGDVFVFRRSPSERVGAEIHENKVILHMCTEYTDDFEWINSFFKEKVDFVEKEEFLTMKSDFIHNTQFKPQRNSFKSDDSIKMKNSAQN